MVKPKGYEAKDNRITVEALDKVLAAAKKKDTREALVMYDIVPILIDVLKVAYRDIDSFEEVATFFEEENLSLKKILEEEVKKNDDYELTIH